MARRLSRSDLIKIHEPLFREYLVPSHLLDDLDTLITKEEQRQIKKKERSKTPKDAVSSLLNILLEKSEPDWFGTFLEALRKNEYEILADHLMSVEELKDPDIFKALLTSFCKQLLDSVDPADISRALLNSKTITDKDVSIIDEQIKIEDKQTAMVVLLLKLPINKENWISDFISALKQVKSCRELADEIDKEISRSDIEELELRSYQKELAEDALSGKNVIIVAPTGSGKSHVALYITKKHMESREEGKVVFLVPTTELVSQQTQLYKKYLPQFRTCDISAEVPVNQMMPLNKLMEMRDITVMTPQILLNALNKETLDSLGDFSLMVFDECHHATKEHPYNKIMAKYMKEKYAEKRSCFLPQIVGLTASLGVGGARDEPGAVKHILSLCANLDAMHGISTVKQHKDELEKFVNKPIEKKIVTSPCKLNPFKNVIHEMMRKIEEYMKNKVEEKKIQLLALKEVPLVKGSDQYTQWLSRLKKQIVMMDREDIHRPLYTCQEHLKAYNTALMINEDCRAVDALLYLEKEFKEINENHKDEIDKWLHTIYDEHKMQLEEISRDPCHCNPKLEALAKIILDKYKENPDMRIILFCKTREMTLALEKWMLESENLVGLCPNRLVGVNSSAERGGMTQHKQVDVLSHFKDGKHKVLIATSVAEEGLDVSKCNLVIRYEYVTNEIAMVQARGRGRAEDSEYVVVGDKTRGTAQKEYLNKIRENLMNEALDRVKHMTSEEYQRRILKLQEEAMINKKTYETYKMQATSSLKTKSDDWELRCVKCKKIGCLACEIRVFKESHHVVMDVDFLDRIIFKPHPKPKQFDDIIKTDKILCSDCHEDWGIRVIHKTVKLCLIKIRSFILYNAVTNEKVACAKWKDVPFDFKKLEEVELEHYASALVGKETL